MAGRHPGEGFATFIRIRRIGGRVFAHSGIAHGAHSLSPPVPCSHRRIGHSARLRPPTDIRPDHCDS
ncbi:hypothetical protein T261_3805 [Streptomyces lydicus]|nr:hypothetical protein T261_3805 [Streptomyces lydicus]